MCVRYKHAIKSVSVGRGDDRRLTIRRKQSIGDLVRQVLLDGHAADPNTSTKYEVFAPGQFDYDKWLAEADEGHTPMDQGDEETKTTKKVQHTCAS